MPDGNGAREALAQVLSDVLDHDLDVVFLEHIDGILTRLYLLGFIVTPAPEENLVTS